MKLSHQLSICSSLVILALACGGGAGAGSQSSSSEKTSLRFKAQAGDNIVVYDLSGGLTSPGNVVASGLYNLSQGYAEITLDPGQSYRLRLRRNDLEYMETVVLADQFVLADAEGNLDAGEISALTTAMSWAAIEVASKSPFLQVDSTLVRALEDAQGSGIQSLADVNKANVESSSLFSNTRKAQLNFLVVIVARVSVHFESQQTLSQSEWSEMVNLIADIITHPDLGGSTAQATSLRAQYITLFNSSGNLSNLVDSSRISNQYVSGNISASDYVQKSQSTVDSEVEEIFESMGISFN